MARGWHQLHSTASDGLDHSACTQTREVGGGVGNALQQWTGVSGAGSPGSSVLGVPMLYVTPQGW